MPSPTNRLPDHSNDATGRSRRVVLMPGIAHEIATPLTVVTGYARLLARGGYPRTCGGVILLP